MCQRFWIASAAAPPRNDGEGTMKQPCVYIMASGRNGTLYIGVTSNLLQRAYQHREGLTEGFTARYDCKTLVWFEACDRMDAAIAREKQLKGGSRRKKLALIEAFNPHWRDLYEDLA
jgi:predicted GIY-YIG superfamily endonuclease